METKVVSIPSRPGAGILHVGPFDTIGVDFDRLGAWMMEHLPALRGAPMSMYLDDPQRTAPERMRTWLVVPVAEALELGAQDAPVEACPLEGGRYLVGIHRGSYAGLAQAWSQFTGAIADSGEHPDPSRPPFEQYVSDPRLTPEDDLITELHQPIV